MGMKRIIEEKNGTRDLGSIYPFDLDNDGVLDRAGCMTGSRTLRQAQVSDSRTSQVVLSALSGWLPSRRHAQREPDAVTLAAGIYVIRYQCGRQASSEKLVID
jgi:hypothetical protein